MSEPSTINISNSKLEKNVIGSQNVTMNIVENTVASFTDALDFLKEQASESPHTKCQKLCNEAYEAAIENGKNGLRSFIKSNKAAFFERVLTGTASTAIAKFFEDLIQ